MPVAEKNAIQRVLGDHVTIAMCSWHKARNIFKNLSPWVVPDVVTGILKSFWKCVFASGTPHGIHVISTEIDAMVTSLGGGPETAATAVEDVQGTNKQRSGFVLFIRRVR